MQTRYEKLMNFSYVKQLDEIKDHLERLEQTKSRKKPKDILPKKVMFSEEVISKHQLD